MVLLILDGDMLRSSGTRIENGGKDGLSKGDFFVKLSGFLQIVFVFLFVVKKSTLEIHGTRVYRKLIEIRIDLEE